MIERYEDTERTAEISIFLQRTIKVERGDALLAAVLQKRDVLPRRKRFMPRSLDPPPKTPKDRKKQDRVIAHYGSEAQMQGRGGARRSVVSSNSYKVLVWARGN